MSTKRSPAQGQATQSDTIPAEEIPDWVNKTPDECSYVLSMYETGGGSVDEVWITRDEYIRLKRHLAALRAYSTGGLPENCIAQLASKEMEYSIKADPQQVAAAILQAREVYRICPDAVAFNSPSFAAKLCEIGQLTGREPESEDDEDDE
jgi:hypothetical protein